VATVLIIIRPCYSREKAVVLPSVSFIVALNIFKNVYLILLREKTNGIKHHLKQLRDAGDAQKLSPTGKERK